MMSVLQPPVGRMTFDSEGTEGGPYASRVLQVPSAHSGLTIGRGYDMKSKTAVQILRDLVAAGISQKDATILSKSAGLFGQAAKNFIKTHKLEKFEITQQQVKLFEITYKAEEEETRRLCTKADVEAKYGKCHWQTLNPAIKQILIDLKFRGDYTPGIRNLLQKYVVSNDTKGFLKILSDRSNWVMQRVPTDRFQRRMNYFKSHMAGGSGSALSRP